MPDPAAGDGAGQARSDGCVAGPHRRGDLALGESERRGPGDRVAVTPARHRAVGARDRAQQLSPILLTGERPAGPPGFLPGAPHALFCHRAHGWGMAAAWRRVALVPLPALDVAAVRAYCDQHVPERSAPLLSLSAHAGGSSCGGEMLVRERKECCGSLADGLDECLGVRVLRAVTARRDRDGSVS